ncbi:Uncharacterised protein [Mycobacteroides abscessus subsp. abscessus]|nr:Uncharacterised protein [Mycobacteroides abscessus subsp. abscessus]
MVFREPLGQAFSPFDDNHRVIQIGVQIQRVEFAQ